MAISFDKIVEIFDEEFKIKETEKDPAMSRFVPMVYDPIGFDWKTFFEKEFCERFNGLMIKGSEHISKVICVVFFNDEVVQKILAMNENEIMIFAHHPVQMECGDPKGEMGKGFLPVNPKLLEKLKAKGISVYTCHAPLDAGSKSGLGTPEAIVNRLEGKIVGQYDPYAHGFAARIVELSNVYSVEELADELKNMADLPYVDIQGLTKNEIKKVVVLPGGGGSYEDIKGAEDNGADCIITGEVTAKIEGERGDKERELLNEYYPKAKLTAIGLSHAGSEFIVMYDIVEWVKKKIGIEADVLSEEKWWR